MHAIRQSGVCQFIPKVMGIFLSTMQTLTNVTIAPAVIHVKIPMALLYACVSLDTSCHLIKEHVKVFILVAVKDDHFV